MRDILKSTAKSSTKCNVTINRKETIMNILKLTSTLLICNVFIACGNSSTGSESGESSMVLSSSLEPESSSSVDFSSSSMEVETSAWHTFTPDNPAIRIVGRGDYTTPLAPTFAWSGSNWSIAFHGTAVKILLTAPGSIFNVFVDGDTIPTSVLDLSNSSEGEHLLAENLTEGEHTITVFKRTEAQYGDATFQGFKVYGYSTLSLFPTITRRIEFIGNSITCGYGDLDSLKENTFDITTEDHYWTYAATTARHLGAESHAICYSGRGLYRNNTGSLNGTLPELFPTISPSTTIAWDFGQWIPEVLVINLGTNDFYLGIPDSSEFVTAGITFIQSIRSHYPATKILMLDGPMLSDYYPAATVSDFSQFPEEPLKGYPSAYIMRRISGTDTSYTYRSQTVCQRYLNAIKNNLVNSGETNVARYSFPAQTGKYGYGADWHPSKAQHAYMAGLLEGWVKTEMGW